MKQTVYLAGGCFWCMVSPFHVLDGIEEVVSGYMGGHVNQPTYEDVKTQKSGHYEVVKLIYDDSIIDFEKVLQAYWRQVDPTDPDGQFHDRGASYRTAIFFTTDDQRDVARKSKEDLEKSKRFKAPIVTEIIPAVDFYDAEDYHQDYYKKEPEAYKKDRAISGRDEFIKKHWGDEYWEIFDN